MRNRAGVAVALIAMTGCAPRGGDAEAAPDFHFIEGTFRPDIGPDGNTLIYRAPEGLIVIDAGRHKTHSQKILDYAAAQGAPIVAIVNTHWHLDHTTGNQDLKAAYPEAKVYATRAVEGALDGFLAGSSALVEERLKNPDLPEADRARMTRGFNTIRGRTSLLPDVARNAATESDIWIWTPRQRPSSRAIS